MNKPITFLSIAIVAVLAIGVLVASGGGGDETASSTSSQTETASQSSESTATSQSSGQASATEVSPANMIQEYSPTALAESTTENNLLFFHAAWCTVCNSVEKNIEASTIPSDLSIFKVDYDSSEGQALAREYNIPVQFSMVQVNPDGQEVTQWVNNFRDGVDEIVGNLL